MKKYVVEFELKAEAMGTQDAEEFIPALVCRLYEVYQILDEYINHFDTCSAYIVNIRPATEEDEANIVHYYD